jgi:hypothetical protein
MPTKSQRVATSQAKLREKKRRGKAAPQTFEAGPTERSLDEDEEESGAGPATPPASIEPRTTASPARAPRASRRTRASEGTEIAATYPYMGAELKRIAVIAAFIFAIIVALTFVLGG